MTIGVISDTHGLLRPEALKALDGVHHILHAGDIGDPEILLRLRGVAPVTAIRGNIDEGGACRDLPSIELTELAGCSFYLLHDANLLDLDPASAGFAAVISGHSHKPTIEWRKGVLFFNPGSAGPRRFRLPVTVGKIVVENSQLHPTIVDCLLN